MDKVITASSLRQLIKLIQKVDREGGTIVDGSCRQTGAKSFCITVRYSDNNQNEKETLEDTEENDNAE